MTLVELQSFFFLTLILGQLRLLLPGCLVFIILFFVFFFLLLAKCFLYILSVYLSRTFAF
jgi:hypothetical protein